MPFAAVRRPALVGLFCLLLPLGLLLNDFSPTLRMPPVAAGFVAPLPEEPDEPFTGKPRLAVLLVFDQFRGDYLIRWERLLGNDGFRRLARRGAWFLNCHYPYAHTVTGPGHASLGNGCSPAAHGIVGNEWFDRAAGVKVYCATTERYQPVPPLTKPKKGKGAGSPDRLLAPTVAESLKEATGGRGRVVSLSLKDRSAILPVGRGADACYWIDPVAGTFVTSTFYRDTVHPWVEAYNRMRPAERWFGRDWLRLRPGLNYALYSGPDDVFGEGNGAAQGRTFPHPMRGGEQRPGERFFTALYTSPFGNDVLLGLVERAIIAEQLGKDDVPDLLCVSFSSNDPVGHAWGPDSQEVLDTTLRSDRQVAQLLAMLDAEVGRGRYTIALSSDHGVGPLPEVARVTHPEARRVDPAGLKKNAEAFLDRTFGAPGGKTSWFQETSPGFYLNPLAMRARKLTPSVVEAALAGWFREQPDVEAACTRTELLDGVSAGDDLGGRLLKSFHPARSGDVFVVLKPYRLPSAPLGTGTGHGTPHSYDTHVPLIVYGPGVVPGVRENLVTPQAAAAILTHALNVPPPKKAEVGVPEGLFVR